MWKDIIGFEGLYKINEYGDVFSIRSNKLLSPYITNKGYKCIDLQLNGRKSKFSIHKLVAIHFIPNPNNYPIVLHKDNNKLNTYYLNLKWGTYSENNSQAINDGLNKVPIPENRKHYQIYNDSEVIECYGAKEIINTIGYGTDNIIRNLLFRNQPIKQGKYIGYKIRKAKVIKPIRFIR